MKCRRQSREGEKVWEIKRVCRCWFTPWIKQSPILIKSEGIASLAINTCGKGPVMSDCITGLDLIKDVGANLGDRNWNLPTLHLSCLVTDMKDEDDHCMSLFLRNRCMTHDISVLNQWTHLTCQSPSFFLYHFILLSYVKADLFWNVF